MGTLDDLYLEWLYAKVATVKTQSSSRTYWILLRQLYSKEFVWFVPNDDNRVEDGRDLRAEFLEEVPLDGAHPDWLDLGCSMLEMLIGLSRRLSFEAEGEPREWFWILLRNVDLARYTDAQCTRLTDKGWSRIDETLNRITHRNYDYDGRGGLFPLNNAQDDQREVELWYQLCAYILERDY